VDGDEIVSTLNYDLTRSAKTQPLEPRLMLTGMYRYMADAGLFTECLTGRRLVVAQERVNVALESAYTKARQKPGEEMKALVDGRIVSRPNADTGAAQPALVVERFVSVTPKETCPPVFAASPLQKTYWRLTQLAGKPVTGAEGREAHLIFAAGGRLGGSDGCNRVTGGYELTGDTFTVGKVSVTRMACSGSADTERAFQSALNGAARLRTVGNLLELYDAAGKRLARFEARPAGK
jgi:copper homeostasis protein (lipoprotein)